MENTIAFYLNDDQQTEICSFYASSSIRFKVGDIIHIKVDELSPAQERQIPFNIRDKMIGMYMLDKQLFDLKAVRIMKEYIHFEKRGYESSFIIEYTCQFV